MRAARWVSDGVPVGDAEARAEPSRSAFVASIGNTNPLSALSISAGATRHHTCAMTTVAACDYIVISYP